MRTSNYLTAVAATEDAVALHSGMSGQLLTMSTDMWQRAQAFVANDDDGHGIEDMLKALVEGRFITDESVNELEVLRGRYLRSRYGGSLGMTVVTSLGCNFDCPYCFEEKHPSKLKPAVRDAIVQIVEDSPDDLPSVNITWMGGEPLHASDELFDLSEQLIAVCERRGFGYSAGVITNGWYLDEAMAKRLAEHHVTAVQVTIDGPPDIHNANRPHVNGGPTYDRVINNVVAAAPHVKVSVRVNISRSNLGRVEELISHLAELGLAGQIGLSAARVTDLVANPDAPVATYDGDCFGADEFADVEIEFDRLAARYGFVKTFTPAQVSTPCTAVRATDLVVGSDGELWKCWDDIGDQSVTIGSIFDYQSAGGDHMDPWLAYDPFSDPHCSTCVALPGCMGGCAHHMFHSDDHTDRCGSFRANHRERVRFAAQALLGEDVGQGELPTITACASSASPTEPAGTPVTLSVKRTPVVV